MKESMERIVITGNNYCRLRISYLIKDLLALPFTSPLLWRGGWGEVNTGAILLSYRTIVKQNKFLISLLKHDYFLKMVLASSPSGEGLG